MVILLPFAVSSYCITELYALCVLLIVLTVRFIEELAPLPPLIYNIMLSGIYYCWPKWVAQNQHQQSRHQFSLEDQSPAAWWFWLQYADFYTWPHIPTFN